MNFIIQRTLVFLAIVFVFSLQAQQSSFQTLLDDPNYIYSNRYLYCDQDMNTYVQLSERYTHSYCMLYRIDSLGNVADQRNLIFQNSYQIIAGSSDSILLVKTQIENNGSDSARIDFMRLKPDLSFEQIINVEPLSNYPLRQMEYKRNQNGEYYVMYHRFPADSLQIKKYSADFQLIAEQEISSFENYDSNSLFHIPIGLDDFYNSDIHEYKNELHLINNSSSGHFVLDKNSLDFLDDYSTLISNSSFEREHHKLLQTGDTSFILTGMEKVWYKGNINYYDLAVGEVNLRSKQLTNETTLDTADNPVIHNYDNSRTIFSHDSSHFFTVYISSSTGDTVYYELENNDLNINVLKMNRNDFSVDWKFQHQDQYRYLIQNAKATVDGGLVILASRHPQHEIINTPTENLVIKVDSSGNFGYYVSVEDVIEDKVERQLYYSDNIIYGIKGKQINIYSSDFRLVESKPLEFGETIQYHVSSKLKRGQLYHAIIDEKYHLTFVK